MMDTNLSFVEQGAHWVCSIDHLVQENLEEDIFLELYDRL